MIDVETESEPGRQAIIRRTCWSIAWVVPVIALITGVSLTVAGTVEQWTPIGEGQFEVTYLAVWPAGLALLAVGLLGVTAAAIAAAMVTTKR
ncbi:hypothetical protein [Microbacterium sp. W4I20]|uniref:hypothetical protein n=1 Tax=Microbacterium sp. W4I20 TaxID=3042262 RepID=UPI002789EEFE|nr:hypothetical protein [Microbacterium sp. W4I20]MDQ0727265.1 hypothetical protein [Microbacterium sp. W4I20]